MVKACGIQHVATVDPMDVTATRRALKEALDFEGPSVVITKRPCVLLDRKHMRPAYHVDWEECVGCKACLRLGCPALGMREDDQGKAKAFIEETQCAGCGLCAYVCPAKAIHQEVPEHDEG